MNGNWKDIGKNNNGKDEERRKIEDEKMLS